MKVCLALGGGGARGYAHIGVLRGLFEMGTKEFYAISGTSAGGMIAGLFAIHKNPEGIYEKIKSFRKSPLFESLRFHEVYSEKDKLRKLYSNIREKVFVAKTLVSQSFLDEETRDRVFEYLYGNDTLMEQYHPRLRIMATDLIKGIDIAFRGGSMHKVMKATSALPGALPPVRLGDMLLVDGGITHNLPILSLLKDECDVIIASDVSRSLPEKKEYRNSAEILIRCEYISLRRLQDIESQFADVIVSPDLKEFEWYEFDKLDEIIERGYRAFERSRPMIDRAMNLFQRAKKRLILNKELIDRLTEHIVYFP